MQNKKTQQNKTIANRKKKPCDKTQQDPLQKIILQKTETKLLVKKIGTTFKKKNFRKKNKTTCEKI